MSSRLWTTAERKTRTVVGVPLLFALYAIAFHWGDWRWRGAAMLAAFWALLLLELCFHKRPGFHSSVLCMIGTGVFALGLPTRALPIAIAGFALLGAGIALYVRGPSSFTSDGP